MLRFVSRTGHVYRQFNGLALTLRAELNSPSAVLEGELFYLDDRAVRTPRASLS